VNKISDNFHRSLQIASMMPGFYKSEENAAYFGDKWDMNDTRCAMWGTIFVDNMKQTEVPNS
jgi:hypothetical protein